MIGCESKNRHQKGMCSVEIELHIHNFLSIQDVIGS